MYVGRYLGDKAKDTVCFLMGGRRVTWVLSVGLVFIIWVMLFFSCVGRQCHFSIRSNSGGGGGEGWGARSEGNQSQGLSQETQVFSRRKTYKPHSKLNKQESLCHFLFFLIFLFWFLKCILGSRGWKCLGHGQYWLFSFWGRVQCQRFTGRQDKTVFPEASSLRRKVKGARWTLDGTVWLLKLLRQSSVLGKWQLPCCKLIIAIGLRSSPVNQGGPCLGKTQSSKRDVVGVGRANNLWRRCGRTLLGVSSHYLGFWQRWVESCGLGRWILAYWGELVWLVGMGGENCQQMTNLTLFILSNHISTSSSRQDEWNSTLRGGLFHLWSKTLGGSSSHWEAC